MSFTNQFDIQPSDLIPEDQVWMIPSEVTEAMKVFERLVTRAFLIYVASYFPVYIFGQYWYHITPDLPRMIDRTMLDIAAAKAKFGILVRKACRENRMMVIKNIQMP